MKITVEKLKAMIFFFATNTDSNLLGKVKLMKLFYFADFGHVKKYGMPITYDNYINLEHGPVPSGILNIINAVENDIDVARLADTISVETNEGSPMKRIKCYRKFTEEDTKYFSVSEMKVLKEVCDRFAHKNTKYLEDQSHKEAAWSKTNELQDIPYSLAAEDLDCEVTKEDIELALKVFK
jgi:uncharacterized phage-associated protein